MAEVKKKRRVIKKAETVREKREKASTTKPKQRRVRQAVKKANTPIKAIGRGITRVFKPLSPLLKPFRTRPARFIGRILAKIFLINYIRDSWRELRQVEWPNRKETAKLTVAVFIFAISFALVIAFLDYGLDKLFRQLLV